MSASLFAGASRSRLSGAARGRRVPLADRAVEILSELAMIKIDDFVFPGAKRGSRPRASNNAGLSEIPEWDRLAMQRWLSGECWLQTVKAPVV